MLSQLTDQPWRELDTPFRREVRVVLDRLRSMYLREGSTYDAARSVLPAIALGLVWLHLVAWTPGPRVGLLLDRSETIRHLLMGVTVVGLWNLWLRLSPYERRSPRKDVLREIVRLTAASLACGGVLLLWELPRRSLLHGLPIAGLGTAGLLGTSLLSLGIFACASVLSAHLHPKRVAIVVGTGRRAELMKASLGSLHPPIELFGCVDDEDRCGAAQLPYLGTISRLPDLLKAHPVELVLIGLPMRSKYDEIQQVIEICETVGVETHYMRDIFDTARSRVQVHSQAPHDFSVISAFVPDPMQHVKRLIDVVGALLLLLLASPLMLAAALAIRLTGHGPVLFVQQRYGRNRKKFPMFKFRSMVVDAEKKQAALESMNEAQGPVFKLASDPRVTPVGSFLRKTSIDELPQLFNVLRGEMSLVGPRPLPHRDVSRFEEPWLLRRFSVRPGLTCIWQVNGRSNTDFTDWIKQDLTYIDQWSLGLDLRILVQTIPAVLRARGAV